MFFEGDRLTAMREMIVASDDEGRKKALARLLPMQRGDFEAIFRAMEGYPVTIRLLDPPLHEFLPHEPEEIAGLAKEMGQDPAETSARSWSACRSRTRCSGLRGCRLGIIYPEITAMQARAIFEAACTVAARKGRVQPEVMIPLAATVVEFRKQALVVRQVAEEVFRERQITVPYLLGTMIELPAGGADRRRDRPRGAVLLLRHQRPDPDDLGTLPRRRRQLPALLPRARHHPGRSLPGAGPGRRRQADRDGRASSAGAPGRTSSSGICGEHGGEPAAVAFCDELGMNYVSCSPFRVPIARLAAAQAALAERGTMDRTRATV